MSGDFGWNGDFLSYVVLIEGTWFKSKSVNSPTGEAVLLGFVWISGVNF